MMFWVGARRVYEECRRFGLCRSQRDFSRRLLGRGPHYMRLVANRQTFVSARSCDTLRRRLAQAGHAVGRDFAFILDEIAKAEATARLLRR